MMANSSIAVFADNLIYSLRFGTISSLFLLLVEANVAIMTAMAHPIHNNITLSVSNASIDSTGDRGMKSATPHRIEEENPWQEMRPTFPTRGYEKRTGQASISSQVSSLSCSFSKLQVTTTYIPFQTEGEGDRSQPVLENRDETFRTEKASKDNNIRTPRTEEDVAQGRASKQHPRRTKNFRDCIGKERRTTKKNSQKKTRIPPPVEVLISKELKNRTDTRISIRQQWRALTQAVFIETANRKLKKRRSKKLGKAKNLPSKKAQIESVEDDPLRFSDLEEFYQKYDVVMEDLDDRRELVELQGFKQLVIEELFNRSEAWQQFQLRVKLVQHELMQKFVIDELIEEGFIIAPESSSSHNDDDDESERLEWVSVNGPYEFTDEWVMCDDF
jgi:hypothetical protein